MAKAETALVNIEYPASEGEQAIINAGLEAWQAYRAQTEGQPETWFTVGAALKIIQELATAKAGASVGGTFNKHWRAAAVQHGVQQIEPSEPVRIIKLMQERDRVRTRWEQL